MFYRPCPDTLPPADTDIDDPAMAEAAATLELGEQDLRMLARLAEIAMRLAEKLGAYAEARLTAVTVEGAAPLEPREDPTAAFNKMAQTVRRILALRARIAAVDGIYHVCRAFEVCDCCCCCCVVVCCC